jgi:hypothetical protein
MNPDEVGDRGPSAEWLTYQVEDILDPIARRCGGWPVATVRHVLERRWQDVFGCDLGEPALTGCAEAIHDRRDWSEALWNGYWSPLVRGERSVRVPEQRRTSEPASTTVFAEWLDELAVNHGGGRSN